MDEAWLFEAGGPSDMASLLDSLSEQLEQRDGIHEQIDQLRSEGWDYSAAEGFILLVRTAASSSLAVALHHRTHAYPASVHFVFESLITAAGMLTEPAPLVYMPLCDASDVSTAANMLSAEGCVMCLST